ncbi:alpha/beta fold hydrolase [Qipengyuania sp. DY56-A-20]|uniref:Alpha/beta fold hydrolase n=1 Tax=Qipengyuania benthica TaxID=3067651 RepID=A0ABT9H4I7_9SPHN|nr:alpha/beta fold hydrolase [Qipengyuania sp. DY56-A-20]MDP4538207.1 alpha/beta fold hydrolase [Qipengyuania sp. DY56-A-20]
MIRALVTLLVLLAAPAKADIVRDRIYHPVSLADTEVEFAGDPPLPLQAVTADGLALAGYYWAPEAGNDRLVVVFHGRDYNQLVMARRAEALREGGHGVLIASYRGYGDNPGEPSEVGLFGDGEAWLAKARALNPEGRIYLFGFSLGAAVALELAARHEVTGVATLGAFTRLADQVPALLRPLLPDRYDNLAAIARVAEPVVLLHGAKDEVVDPEAAVRLEQAGGANVTRVNLKGGEHFVPLESIAARLWSLWARLEAAAVEP